MKLLVEKAPADAGEKLWQGGIDCRCPSREENDGCKLVDGADGMKLQAVKKAQKG